MARLIAQGGDLDGQTFAIDPGVTVGRERHNDVAMPSNRKASRDHCKVWREGPNRFAVADLGSTNGTLVNNQKITRTTLSDGDEIRIGDVVLVFELEEAEKKPKRAQPEEGPRPDLAAVLRGDAAPERPTPGTGAAAGAQIEVKQRILQYKKKRKGGSALGWDLSQMAGLSRWVLILVAVGLAVGIFLLVMNATVSQREQGDLPKVEDFEEDE